MNYDSNIRHSNSGAYEERRLADVHALELLDTAYEERFDRITRLIADIFRFPVVFVSLLDRDRQWFKSALGMGVRETVREISFCNRTVQQEEGLLVVPDAHQDERFRDTPLVTGPPYIRFYAGAVVHGPSGYPVGTTCVIDHQPREFSEQQCNQLREFAALVERELKHSHEIESLKASVTYTAYYDTLTGLPNRRLFNDRLERLLELCDREQRTLAVLLVNIKGLRLLNQAYGTRVGDNLLGQVADRLREACPAGGTVARLQADEFVLAAPAPERQSAYIDTCAEHLRKHLDGPFALDGHQQYLNIQLGGAVFPEHGTTANTLVERAAAAIHSPRRDVIQRRLRIVGRKDVESISRNLEVESRLRAEREQGFEGFELHYQPIVRVSDGCIAGYEALLRWEDRDLGRVSPGDFLSVAEQSGLIMPIGDWVAERACRQLGQWQKQDGHERFVSINVEAVQLEQAGFAEQILQALQEHGVTPGQLHIEVTEFSLVGDSLPVKQCMDTLADAGVRIYIDDFGTGYSSLEYLRRMPIAGVKLDRFFIAGLPDDESDITLTRTVLRMAQGLGFQTVAEGVEKPEQYQFLREEGCDMVQGFLLARPVPPGEAIALPGCLSPDR